MANKHASLGDLFTAIAEAIRTKTGSTAAIVADNFPEAIMNLSSSDLTVKELVPTNPTDPTHFQPTPATITAGGNVDVLIYHNLNISNGDILLVGREPYGSIIGRVTSRSTNSGQTYDDYRYISSVIMYNHSTAPVSVSATHKLYKITD